MNKLNQQGIAHILAILSLLLIVAGVAVTVFLVGKQQIFKSKASVDGTRIEIFGPTVSGDRTTSRNIKLRLVYVPPSPSPSPSPSPVASVIATPSPSPLPQCPMGLNCSLGSAQDQCSDSAKPYKCEQPGSGMILCCNQPNVQGVSTAYAQGVFPTHFRVSQNREGLSQAREYEFTGNPTEIDWTLIGENGQKTIYAQFKLNGSYDNQPVLSASVTLQVATPVFSNNSITKKVLLVIYDPVLSNGQKLHQLYPDWSDPNTMVPQIISSIKESSGDFVNYQVVETAQRNEWAKHQDGFRYTESTYKTCMNDVYSKRGNGRCNQTNFDYNQLWTDLNICQKVSSGAVDEVFVYIYPYGATDEYAVKIPGDIMPYNEPTNGWFYDLRKKNIPDCNGKTVWLMGWNYERGVTEALHSYGHRIENALGLTVGRGFWDGCKGHNGIASDFDRFTCINQDIQDSTPVKVAGCGNIHFAFNGVQIPRIKDYDYDNRTLVNNACNSWLHYPFTDETITAGNCSIWGCYSDPQRTYIEWWMSHLPRSSGGSNGNLDNWWKYIADFDNAITEARSYTAPPACPKGRDCVLGSIQDQCTDSAKPYKCEQPGSGMIYCCNRPSPSIPPLPTPTPRPTPQLSSGLEGIINGENFGLTPGKVYYTPVRGNTLEAEIISWSDTSIRVRLTRRFELGQVVVIQTARGRNLTGELEDAPPVTPSPSPSPSPFVCTPCAADIAGGTGGNPDGAVNILDFSFLQSCFNKDKVKNPSDWNRCSKADITKDNAVSILDFSCLASQFNQQCPEHKRRD